jgi:hypothetical protein
VETTSERAESGLRVNGQHTLVGPLLRELERISGHADTERAVADQAIIAELREEIAALRAAVAHLRAGTTALPGHLRPVVARAMISVDRTGRAEPSAVG